MKKMLFVLFVCVFFAVFLVGCGEKGIDSPVSVSGDRIQVKSITVTEKYEVMNGRYVKPVSSNDTLIVIEGDVKNKVNTLMCNSGSMHGATLKWYDNSLQRSVKSFVCGFNTKDSSFILIYIVPKEGATKELYTLHFANDVSIRLWKLKFSK